MAKLLLKFRGQIIREIPLDKAYITVGRIEGNEIIINNLGVSRHHARILREGGEFFIEDMQSANGTLVNNDSITGKRKLKDRDIIEIGKHYLVFFLYGQVEEGIQPPVAQAPLPRSRISRQALPPEETLQIKGESAVTPKVHRRLTPSGIASEVKAVETGVKIVDGAVGGQNIIIFKRAMIVAGKDSSAHIRIKGEYEKNVVFTISNRFGEYYISPPKGIVLKVNGVEIDEYTKINKGDTIEAAETKMLFFMRPTSSLTPPKKLRGLQPPPATPKFKEKNILSNFKKRLSEYEKKTKKK